MDMFDSLSVEKRAEVQQIIGAVIEGFGAQQKQDKLARFKRLNKFAKPGQILFAGSSLMEQFPIYEFLLDFDLPYTIYNRGVGGFTTAELADALDVCVLELKPRHIFINIGTNDLNGEDYREQELVERYRRILAEIRANLPSARLHLLAYYPVNEIVGAEGMMGEVFKHRTNERIRSANEAVKKLAAEFGAEFFDLNDGITDADGRLKAEYTVEGMHMYADGYKPVLDRLLPILKALD